MISITKKVKKLCSSQKESGLLVSYPKLEKNLLVVFFTNLEKINSFANHTRTKNGDIFSNMMGTAPFFIGLGSNSVLLHVIWECYLIIQSHLGFYPCWRYLLGDIGGDTHTCSCL